MNERKVTKVRVAPESFRISKVGVYCRVSSNRIEQLRSMAFQVSHLTRTALKAGGWIFDFHSGLDDTRPELQRERRSNVTIDENAVKKRAKKRYTSKVPKEDEN